MTRVVGGAAKGSSESKTTFDRREFCNKLVATSGALSLAGCADFESGTTETSVTLEITDCEVVDRVTGEDSVNRTADKWGIHGTDLGHTFTHRGEMYMVFGDTFGRGGLGGNDWRSNAMARLPKNSADDGLIFESMITGPDGNAKELLGSRKIDGDEITVIPTWGISDGERMYLYYMSVRSWGEPGRWEANHSGIAYSDDDGKTWTKDPDAIWPGDSNFVQASVVSDGDYRYVFGISAGRFGGVALARFDDDPLHLDAYEYWDGSQWTTGNPSAATTIVPPPVGELSVHWSPYHDRWLLMYLNDRDGAIVLRTAHHLTGPWDDERVVVSRERHPQLYAPYIVPPIRGPEVHFTMSRFDIYNVLHMRKTLQITQNSG